MNETNKSKKEHESEEMKPPDSDESTTGNSSSDDPVMPLKEALRRAMNTPPIPTKDIQKPPRE